MSKKNDQPKGDVVKLIFRRYLEGDSLRGIAEWLNAEHPPSSRRIWDNEHSEQEED